MVKALKIIGIIALILVIIALLVFNEEMACVPQFDTMHPSMSLGAFFNDRDFRRLSFLKEIFLFKI